MNEANDGLDMHMLAVRRLAALLLLAGLGCAAQRDRCRRGLGVDPDDPQRWG